MQTMIDKGDDAGRERYLECVSTGVMYVDKMNPPR
jgi:hypothetical protein